MGNAGEVNVTLTGTDASLSSTVGAATTKLQEFGAAAEGASEQTRRSATEMEKFEGIATRMVERLILLAALRGAMTFTEDLFKNASALVAQSQEFDTSIGTMERWQQATAQSGESLTTLTGASDALTKKLSKGDKGLGDAIDQLGLSWNQLWNMNAGARMDVIGNALQGVTDKVTRSGLEFEIFGTDKIDPVLSKLKDVASTMEDDDVRALDAAKKSVDLTITSVETLAAKWLVAAQNAVYYAKVGPHPDQDATSGNPFGSPALGMAAPFAYAAGAGADANEIRNWKGTGTTKSKGSMSDEEFIALQIEQMGGVAGKGTKGVEGNINMPGGAIGAPGTSKSITLKDQAAAERELTDQVRIQIQAEREQAAFEAEAFRVRMQFMKETRLEMEATNKMWLTETNNMVLAELAARKSVNASRGNDINGIPLAQANDPRNVAQRQMLDLQAQKERNPGIDTTFREQQIRDQLNSALDLEMKQTIANANASAEAASANKSLGLAASEAAARLSGMGRVNAPTPSSMDAAGIRTSTLYSSGYTLTQQAPKPTQIMAEGGPTYEGPAYLHDNEFVVPSGGALVKSGGGGGAVNLTVQVMGNVNTMDPSGKAAFAASIQDALEKALRQGRKLPAA